MQIIFVLKTVQWQKIVYTEEARIKWLIFYSYTWKALEESLTDERLETN